jgi:hypothetical protein
MITSEIIKLNNYNTTVVQQIYPQQVEQNLWNFIEIITIYETIISLFHIEQGTGTKFLKINLIKK